MSDQQSSNTLPTRRDVLKLMSAAVGGAAAGACGSMFFGRLDSVLPGGWRFFTSGEARLVEAVAQHIIPQPMIRTDRMPGDRTAGTVDYIDRQLAGPDRRFQTTYRRGLESLQAASRMLSGRDFESIPQEEQTKLLVAIEAGGASDGLWSDPKPVVFFDLICRHTLQSFCAGLHSSGNRTRRTNINPMTTVPEYPRILGRNRCPAPFVV